MNKNLPQAKFPKADMVAILVALSFPTLVTLIYFVLLADASTGLQQAAYSIGKGLQFAFPLVWFLVIQKRRLRWKGPTRAGLYEGSLFGAAVIVSMIGLYYTWLQPSGYLSTVTQAVGEKVVGFGVSSPVGYAAMGIFYALCHSFLEEYYWRWFVFRQLRSLLSLRMAILVSSLGFMAHHVLVLSLFFGWFSFPSIFFSASVAIGGAYWAWLYDRTDSLYGPWLSHLLVDTGIFAVGYLMIWPRLAM